MSRLKNIMLVDDDEVYQFIFSQMVENSNLGARVTGFESAQDGFNYLQDTIKKMEIGENVDLPDLIFLDINMPVMNGWDFLNALRKLPGEAKEKLSIAMLSTSVFDSDKEKAKEFKEVIDFVVKPISGQALLELDKKYFS